MCQDGWFGPFCSLSYNPCNNNKHNCSEGSTCVPLVAGYECDCPIGKTGKYCEKGIESKKSIGYGLIKINFF